MSPASTDRCSQDDAGVTHRLRRTGLLTANQKDIKDQDWFASASKESFSLKEVPSSASSDSMDSLHYGDAGNLPGDHYKHRMSWLRYTARSLLLPVVRAETPWIEALQLKLRLPALDAYFAWTACLASHTFYVVMLPLPIWFGGLALVRDLVFVIGFGIYVSGSIKDWLCLPRPRSPPVHRITMLSYTALEYGFPLSHSANATGVILTLWWRLATFRQSLSWMLYALLAAGLCVYYLSLILGRLYCGMHGFVDLIAGLIVGIACFLVRYAWADHIDNMLLSNGHAWISGLSITVAYASLVHIHADPVDDCPCFDDSVAFVGVLIGVEWAFLAASSSQYLARLNPLLDPYLIVYDLERLGWVKSMLRVLLGMILVVVWKAILKPIVFSILPPIYKLVRVNLPRRNFIATAYSNTTTRQIRSTLISNINLEENDMNVFAEIQDEIGPELESDFYELEYQRSRDPALASQKDTSPEKKIRPARYDVEIVGRLIVYAGIPITAIWGFVWASRYLGLD